MAFGQTDPAALILAIVALIYAVGSAFLSLWTVGGKRYLANRSLIGRWSSMKEFRISIFEQGSGGFSLDPELDTWIEMTLPLWRSCDKAKTMVVAKRSDSDYIPNSFIEKDFGIREGGLQDMGNEMCWIPFDDLFVFKDIGYKAKTTGWAEMLDLHVAEHKLQIRQSSDEDIVNVTMDERALAIMLLCFGTSIIRTDNQLKEHDRLLLNSPRLYSRVKPFGRVVYFVEFRGPVPFAGTSPKDDRVRTGQILFLQKLIAEIEYHGSLVEVVLHRGHEAEKVLIEKLHKADEAGEINSHIGSYLSESFSLAATVGTQDIPTYYNVRDSHPSKGHLYILGWLMIAQTAVRYGKEGYVYVQYIPMDPDVIRYLQRLLTQMSFESSMNAIFPGRTFEYWQFSKALLLLESRKRVLDETSNNLLLDFERWLTFLAKQKLILGRTLQSIAESSRETLVEVGK